jgi:putative heme-binding domain-containing protein
MGNKSSSTTVGQRAAATLLTFALPLFLVFAPSSRSTSAQPQENRTPVEAGRRIFLGSCSMTYCHGNEGNGGGAPRLRDREFSSEFLTLVITQGIPGTNMPAFNRQYNKQQIDNLVAYLLTLSPGSKAGEKGGQAQPSGSQHLPTAPLKSEPSEVAPNAELSPTRSPMITNGSSDLRGDVGAGRELFFDSAQIQNCRVCHTVQGVGGKVGPDLTPLANKPPREILQSIVAPHAAIEEKYAAIAITTRGGEKFTGIKRDEDEKMIRLYDTSTLPPVSRAFLKSEVAKTEKLDKSAMPADYASKFTLKQLLDLVSFLKSSSVGLKDLF